MSDDLKKRLRKTDEYEPLGHDGWEALNRIEELEAELAKAVEALEYYGGWSDGSGGICGFDGGSLARTTRAELSSTTK